jgi:hypothetical protein
MSGKPGQKSEKATDVSGPYDPTQEVDGRSVVGRTLRDRLRGLVSDLGGLTNLSYQELSLCKRITHLERLLERQESILAHSGSVDLNCYYSAINTLSGLFSKIGMKRRARKIQSLEDYLKRSTPAPGPAHQDTTSPQPIKED